jgi:CHASE2 domain-containing sensor protein
MKWSWWWAILVFAVDGGIDVLWVFYTKAITKSKALWAAILSVLLLFAGAITILSYVENKLYLIPAAIGSFVCTYFAVKFDKKFLRR